MKNNIVVRVEQLEEQLSVTTHNSMAAQEIRRLSERVERLETIIESQGYYISRK